MIRPGGPLALGLRWARQRWLPLAGLGLLAYFIGHGLTGERGLRAWLEVHRELPAARAELARLEAERRRLEAMVDALQPDRSDPDLVEELLRRLGYVGERESVLLVPDKPAR